MQTQPGIRKKPEGKQNMFQLCKKENTSKEQKSPSRVTAHERTYDLFLSSSVRKQVAKLFSSVSSILAISVFLSPYLIFSFFFFLFLNLPPSQEVNGKWPSVNDYSAFWVEECGRTMSGILSSPAALRLSRAVVCRTECD